MLTKVAKRSSNIVGNVRRTVAAQHLILFHSQNNKDKRYLANIIGATQPIFLNSSKPPFLSITKSILEQKSAAIVPLEKTNSNNQNYPTNVQQNINRYHKRQIQSIFQYIQLNKKIANSTSCKEIFNLIEHSLTLTAGNGVLNDVNFATIVNRLAHHVLRNGNERNIIINDRQFALLFATLAEAMVSKALYKASNDKELVIDFYARQLENIGWSIAKLGVTAPFSEVPMLQSSINYNKENTTIDVDAPQAILTTALRLRKNIDCNGSQWQPELSELTSQLLDYIGSLMSTEINTLIMVANDRNSYNLDTLNVGQMDLKKIQGCTNLLWAWATAGRAIPEVFEIFAQYMVQRGQIVLQTGSNDTLKPQEWTNAVWAVCIIKL
jgi:hypothetical protein